MRFDLDDTIAALASPPGPGARGIVRLSGPAVAPIIASCFESTPPALWRRQRIARRYPGTLTLSGLTAPLPADLYYWPTNRSYTGESIAELHTIGSPPLLEAALSELCRQGARPARAGEFTLRAFLSGRIDLMQAEAVCGVIDAADHQELELALGQLAGGVSGKLADVRVDLIALLGDLEAGLDFVEEDIEFISREALAARLEHVRVQVERLQEQVEDRMQSTGRARVVLAGRPNAGKSTLFNALVRGERALVSRSAGTTRDFLSAEADCDGVRVELIDTAGRGPSNVEIGRLAQKAGTDQLRQADLVVWCVAADLDAAGRNENDVRLNATRAVCPRVLIARTRSDLAGHDSAAGSDVAVSAMTGAGIETLRAAIGTRLSWAETGQRQLLGSTSTRCQDSLSAIVAALERARDATDIGLGDEIIAIEIRAALEGLGQILGEVYTDDILDHIFSSFCIGK